MAPSPLPSGPAPPKAAPPATAATATALGTTLGVAAACWVVAVHQMSGMGMGVATPLGSFASFAALWVSMMAAMMLPGLVAPVVRVTYARARLVAAPLFVASYLAVWAIVGLLVYAVYRPHGTVAAGVAVIAAGAYECTPIKRRLRQRCREGFLSGSGYGVCCVGSSIALMLMFVALGVMSVAWMSVIAVVVVAQKLLPPNAAFDASLAIAIVALGVLILVAPSSIPGLMPSM
jgi:predicted metal-binding membrane protein